ncbi:unnamed protein product [Trypanosoma congolense IL3000]|uniref:WGS project CAEQ00000000 data, annotated contig 1860 n=1 Tax=Trypanosoma congolense (strain IL3000) TaxID=1068625 RepID=F9W9H1_TRYCI|nr:unnamed protein product [Trypanosoma congolense IL3000]
MRRFPSAFPTRPLLRAPRFTRHCQGTPETPDTIKNAIAADEMAQRRREEAVDSRSVVFACGSSADHRPRIAAAEAFDVAAAALPHTPNFCFLNVSFDYAAMVDAPEVVWYNLCRANSVTPSTVRPQELHMIGGATRMQRPGGGFIQVLLGCIPDLQSDIFTFDTVPEEEDLKEPNRPPPAICFAFMDSRLTLQYERQLTDHLQVLGERLGECPLIGGVYPASQKSANDVGSRTGGDGNDQSLNSEMGDSLFYLNDRVYVGSAAGAVIRSKMVKARFANIIPSISVHKARVTSCSQYAKGVYTIEALDNRRATDVIRDIYCLPEMQGKPSKVFLGLHHGDLRVPVSFIGDPSSGELRFTAPKRVEVHSNETIELLVDDVELDSEVGAGALIGLQKQAQIKYVEKDINVAGDARRSVVASSAAAFHFSHPGMNVLVHPDVNLTLGSSSVLYAPSLLQRCLGRFCPSTGAFCPGQVASFDGVSGVFSRSSSYAILEGLS